MEKMASIDAQLRLLVPSKVSEDDNLVEYDALLLDRFLDILQGLHGNELKETVRIWVFFFSFWSDLSFWWEPIFVEMREVSCSNENSFFLCIGLVWSFLMSFGLCFLPFLSFFG